MSKNNYSSLNEKVHTCYICGSKHVAPYRKVSGFRIYKCGACDLIWVGDAINQDELEAFYDHDYYSNYYMRRMGYRNYLGGESNHRKNARNLIRTIDKIKDIKGLRVLDIGCACGFYLDEARKIKNCEVIGLEHSAWANRYASEHLHLAVFRPQNSHSLNFESDYFDLVLLLGTIEHLTDPRKMLAEIHRIMKPGSLLMITTVDTKGILPLFHLKPPEHLFYFNHGNLLRLLGQEGFTTVKRSTYFCNYFMYEVFNILSEFPPLSVLKLLSKAIVKHLPNVSVKLPTNEMLVIVRKA